MEARAEALAWENTKTETRKKAEKERRLQLRAIDMEAVEALIKAREAEAQTQEVRELSKDPRKRAVMEGMWKRAEALRRANHGENRGKNHE